MGTSHFDWVIPVLTLLALHLISSRTLMARHPSVTAHAQHTCYAIMSIVTTWMNARTIYYQQDFLARRTKRKIRKGKLASKNVSLDAETRMLSNNFTIQRGNVGNMYFEVFTQVTQVDNK